ncbi:MAG: M1 family metallopeptidase [Bacteroidia bacterium]|nr:M1 family metallopeptidase [Bacteroidia bacterium]MDW8159571.1 M1 family metallopeptidase [Bacteroidia bacterium]
MKYPFCSALIISLFLVFCKAQDKTVFPISKYNTSQNPYYWKNKLPYPGYWQQDVHYTIRARLDVEAEVIIGSEELVYWNNSPDTLHRVYFHLYQNAFIKDSYYYQLQLANDQKPILSYYEKNGKGIEVLKIAYNDKAINYKVDNTILKIDLPHPILPQSQARFKIEFRTYFGRGSQRRRMKVFDVPEIQKDGSTKLVKHFDVVHWYPRICVYDRKFRWCTDQHLSREFYGDFGTYDVAITLPNNYILDGTGELLNEQEVLPFELKQKLHINNFKHKKIGTPAQQIIVPDGTQKTWYFHAENVHDFAFTADPTYRIDEVNFNGVRCIALAREENAAGWQDAAQINAKCISIFSKDIGPYIYPKMIVADAKDGMEYPMLTLDGGISPTYTSLLAHEIGHNWFFGMIGNNETYRAFLDEGFTQFLTAWALIKLVGPNNDPEYPKKDSRYTEVFYGYLKAARAGEDGFLNTHSDMFHGALGHGGGYGQVYFKTATMLYNLQYLLGDKLFLEAMQFYFKRWQIAHPYPEDFRQAIIDYTKVDLNWFFDQWLETDKVIDYSISYFHRRQKGREAKIKFQRKGRMQMPIDFCAILKNGDTLHYTIPNTDFIKADKNRIILPKWYGWDKINPRYTTVIQAPAPIKKVIIDPTLRLADINRLDNVAGEFFIKQTQWHFMKKDFSMPPWDKYLVNIHPNLWWNGFAGLHPGVTLKGSYMNDAHRLRLSIWFNTGVGQTVNPLNANSERYSAYYHKVSILGAYVTPFALLGKGTECKLSGEFRDGLQVYYVGLERRLFYRPAQTNTIHKVYARYKYMYREKVEWADYLIYPDFWSINKVNSTVALGISSQFQEESLNLELRTTGPASDFSFAIINLEAKGQASYFKNKLQFRFRFFAQYADGILPFESSLFLAHANPETMAENDFFRARGFFPDAWVRNEGGIRMNHIQYGGGLNLRGYTGIWSTFEKDNVRYASFVGNNGFALNYELYFDRLFVFRPRYLSSFINIQTYLFYDIGAIGHSKFSVGWDEVVFDKIKSNAGVGLVLNIKAINLALEKQNLAIRLDFPFVVSHPLAGEEEIKFRWILGIGKCF